MFKPFSEYYRISKNKNTKSLNKAYKYSCRFKLGENEGCRADKLWEKHYKDYDRFMRLNDIWVENLCNGTN